MIRTRQILLVMAVAFMVSVAAAALPITTFFGPTPDPAGVICSATAVISLFNSTTIDVALTNTSPLMTFGSQKVSANYEKFDFDLPAGFTLDTTNSKVWALAADSVRFSSGTGNPVVTTLIDRLLTWTYNTHGAKQDDEAKEHSNNNAIFSSNCLVGGIPQDNVSTGFFHGNPGSGDWSGAVFDTIHFYIKVTGGTLTDSDLSMYADDHLTIHFRSGLDSIWLDNQNPPIPEPSSWMLLLGVFPCGAAWAIRRKLCN